jgi:tetratricopeptide (TPR) repeat protein
MWWRASFLILLVAGAIALVVYWYHVRKDVVLAGLARVLDLAPSPSRPPQPSAREAARGGGPAASGAERRSAAIPPTFTLDLESGAVGGNPKADLWWHFATRTERTLDAFNGAGLALIEDLRFEDVDRARLARLRYTYSSLPASGPGPMVKPGALVAVRTAEGNYAKVRILEAGSGQSDLRLEWEIYPAPGQAVASPDGLPSPDVWKVKAEMALKAYRAKRREEAEQLYAEALASAERAGPDHARVAWVLHRSGSMYWSMRQFEHAESRLLRAARIVDALKPGDLVNHLGASGAFLANDVHRMLGIVYRDQRRYDQAALHFRKAVTAAQGAASTANPGTQGWIVSSNLFELAMAQCRLGRLADAQASLDAARKAHTPGPGTKHLGKSIDWLEQQIRKGTPCMG